MRYRDIRLPSDMDLQVVYASEVFRAQLLNISTTGARLGKLRLLPRDAILTLCNLHVRIQAQVAWSNNTQTGVRFPIPLSTNDMNVLRGVIGTAGAWGNSSHQGLREMT